MDEFNSQQLIELCKSGDQNAFEELIKQYHRPLYNYIYNFIEDKDYIDDIVQEIFIKVINNIEKYNSRKDTKFSTWLFTVAKNTILDEHRKKKLNVIFLDNDSENIIESSENIEDLIVQKDELEGIKKALNCLSNETRSMIYLKYYMNFSYKEISDILSMDTKKVKWKLHDTLEKLRKILNVKEVKSDEV